jgi:hypothetical protein
MTWRATCGGPYHRRHRRRRRLRPPGPPPPPGAPRQGKQKREQRAQYHRPEPSVHRHVQPVQISVLIVAVRGDAGVPRRTRDPPVHRHLVPVVVFNPGVRLCG